MKKTVFFALLLLMSGTTVLAQESKVQHLNRDSFIEKVWDFEKNPKRFVFKGKTPAIVDFYADWCGPCRMIAPIMEKLAKEYDGQLAIYKVNIDQSQDLASIFQVTSIPMVLFITKEGRFFRLVGAHMEADYRQAIDEQLIPKPKQ